MNKYLLRTLSSDGRISVRVCNAKEVCDTLEYSDLNEIIQYDVKLIDEKKIAFHRVRITSRTVDYSTGMHYLFILNSKNEIIDDVQYLSDH